ncbi:uncharacterized protein EDB91DRAFT_215677 [Suillus paluster]|uniref:uncharacterized protein n=1 Tax=Suillus paluster TaxID=48578 RepID=UPI001B875738|nr:uncharacterized protein EDB91DRAFT_215677 [Suillus paluster]KAG1722223.1 hypothetical protein EDB91DRAFT_215677 [Suillus paluster]
MKIIPPPPPRRCHFCPSLWLMLSFLRSLLSRRDIDGFHRYCLSCRTCFNNNKNNNPTLPLAIIALATSFIGSLFASSVQSGLFSPACLARALLAVYFLNFCTRNRRGHADFYAHELCQSAATNYESRRIFCTGRFWTNSTIHQCKRFVCLE